MSSFVGMSHHWRQRFSWADWGGGVSFGMPFPQQPSPRADKQAAAIPATAPPFRKSRLFIQSPIKVFASVYCTRNDGKNLAPRAFLWEGQV